MTNYKFDDSIGMQPVPIIVTEGKCEGIKVQYGRIAFDENEQEDKMELKFDYNLMENPNELEEDQEFINILGGILVNILEEEIKEVGENFLKETETNEDS